MEKKLHLVAREEEKIKAVFLNWDYCQATIEESDETALTSSFSGMFIISRCQIKVKILNNNLLLSKKALLLFSSRHENKANIGGRDLGNRGAPPPLHHPGN